ncbi:MAG: response regulator [bacterium]|nr:response regulator [bacterium]
MKEKYKILIVDDDENFRKALIRFLSANKFVAEEVKSGEEAIERLKKESFAIIFLDLDMPGMGGLKALKIIKENHPHIYVIIITASIYGDAETINEARDSGADDFIFKGDKDELIFRISKAISKIELKRIIIWLIKYYIERYAEIYKKKSLEISAELEKSLQNYSYKEDNIKELIERIEEAIKSTTGDTIHSLGKPSNDKKEKPSLMIRILDGGFKVEVKAGKKAKELDFGKSKKGTPQVKELLSWLIDGNPHPKQEIIFELWPESKFEPKNIEWEDKYTDRLHVALSKLRELLAPYEIKVILEGGILSIDKGSFKCDLDPFFEDYKSGNLEAARGFFDKKFTLNKFYELETNYKKEYRFLMPRYKELLEKLIENYSNLQDNIKKQKYYNLLENYLQELLKIRENSLRHTPYETAIAYFQIIELYERHGDNRKMQEKIKQYEDWYEVNSREFLPSTYTQI